MLSIIRSSCSISGGVSFQVFNNRLLSVGECHFPLPSRKPTLMSCTFFHILIFHGQTVAQWRKAGYKSDTNTSKSSSKRRSLMLRNCSLTDSPSRGTLSVTKEAAKRVSCSRNSTPRRRTCHPVYGSNTSNAGQAIFTDDVSLQVSWSI
ncbi:hypothetical protein BD410DRAFT_631661 [Rickenella mellea]|uniref:Uncharacterized protein n=1 Tax=Rickenella mellea TaxID=50990 RepID=A0A4Y7QCT4_9AGAM|nr:hypothetical protein BD410DRAFT_631661 [Rickenella mellea]